MEQVESARVSGLLGWLEEEQHQTKAQLARFQHQIDQLSNLVREQTGQIRVIQEELGASRNQLSRLAQLDELVRQLREAIARLQTTYSAHLEATDKEDKAQQADIERLKQVISEMWQRIDSVYREFEPLLGKVQSMGDTAKRHQEVVAEVVKKAEDLDRLGEALVTRVQMNTEQSKRSEEDIERINRQLETLQGQDDIITTKVQLVADKVKQIDERVAEVMAEEQQRLDLGERLQVVRLEQQRLERQMAEMTPMVDIYAVRLDEQAREIRQVDERRQLVSEDLSELRQVLAEHTARIERYIISIQELEEKHRRRQMSELELQAGELKERTAKLKGQVL